MTVFEPVTVYAGRFCGVAFWHESQFVVELDFGVMAAETEAERSNDLRGRRQEAGWVMTGGRTTAGLLVEGLERRRPRLIIGDSKA